MSFEATTTAELIVLGKVGKPHGLQGAFFVAGRDEPVPLVYRDIKIGTTPQTARPARLTESRMQAGRPLVRCSAAANRDEAEALTGLWLYVERQRAQTAARGVWLWAELAGVELYGSDGQGIGRIDHVYNTGASDVVHVRDGSGRSLDLPLIDDYFDLGASATVLATKRLDLKVPKATFDELWETKA